MPRQKTEAITFLDIHKLIIEKKRLHGELELLTARQQKIQQRIACLNQQVAQLERGIQEKHKFTKTNSFQTQDEHLDSFETLLVDY
jgi:prefoldin subunit 5